MDCSEEDSRQDSEPEAESWMDLVKDEPQEVLPFGEGPPEAYDLYPCYEHYFHALLENAEIMHSQPTTNRELVSFLHRLNTYVRDQVMRGTSDYGTYHRFLENEFTRQLGLKEAFEQWCRLSEQPQLPIFVKSNKTLVDKPPKQKLLTKEPAEQVSAKQLALNNHYAGNLNLVLVGQVDHGKSTLLGRILREFSNEQTEDSQGQLLSAYTDIYEKEKEKGKTIEFSTSNVRASKCRLTIFDTPGHRNYMSNMVLALRVADIVVLVVSAKKGEFESGMNGGTIGQVLFIARSFGIKRLAVIVNKMSACQWERTIFTKIKTQLIEYLAQNGIVFEQTAFIPFDSISGDNFSTKKYPDDVSLSQWMNSLEAGSLEKAEQDLRFSVFDVQQIYQSKHVFGKLEAGYLQRWQPITFYPSGFQTSVQAIYLGDQKTEFAACGDFVSVVLKTYDESIQRGSIATLKESVPSADSLQCKLSVVGDLVASGFECVMHILDHIENVSVEVKSVQNNGRLLRRNFMKKGQKGIARLKILKGVIAIDRALCCNIILRSHDKTVAAGELLRIRRQQG